MSSTSHPDSVVLFGAGRVGTAVAAACARAGYRIAGVASPRRSSAESAAERLGCPVYGDPAAMTRDAGIVLIGAPDNSLRDAAAAILPGIRPGTFVCHFSGATGAEPFTPLAEKGAATAAVHPVQAFADFVPPPLEGCAWGISCDDSSYERASSLVHDLSGVPVRIAGDDRLVWHAAAVLTSNGLAALIATSELLLSGIGVENPAAILMPLARGTIENIERAPSAASALTGPVVRGEVDTIERHVESLSRQGRDALDAYKRASRMILEVAAASGRIDRRDKIEIEKVLAR